MRALILLVSAFCIASLIACSPKASGVYLATGPDEVIMLLLVEGAEGRLSGVLQSIDADEGHRISARNISLSGLVDQSGLTLSPTATFSSRGTLSGVRDAAGITLAIAGRSGLDEIHLRRSSLREFAQQAEQLRARHQELAAAEAEQVAHRRRITADREMRSKVIALSQALRETAANDVTWRRHADAAARQFASYTEEARDTVAAQRTEPDGVRRSQLAVYRSQISVQTTQLNIQVEQTKREFEQHRNVLHRRTGEATSWCARVRDPACAELEAASARYAEASNGLAAAFARAAAAHHRAEAEQQSLSDYD